MLSFEHVSGAEPWVPKNTLHGKLKSLGAGRRGFDALSKKPLHILHPRSGRTKFADGSGAAMFSKKNIRTTQRRGSFCIFDALFSKSFTQLRFSFSERVDARFRRCQTCKHHTTHRNTFAISFRKKDKEPRRLLGMSSSDSEWK